MEEDFLEDMELMVEDLKDLLTDVLEAIAHHACQSEPACRRATEIQTTEPAGEGGPPPEARRVRAGDPRARRRFLWRVFPAPGEEPERQDSRVSKKAGHRGRNRRQRKTRDRTRVRRRGAARAARGTPAGVPDC